MGRLQFGVFFFLAFGLSAYWAETVKKTTKDAEDVDDYYKYTVENIPVHWDQYWIERKAFIPIPSGVSNFSVDLPFSFPFYSHPVNKIFIFPAGFISMTIAEDEHRSKYIAPLLANLDPHHDQSSGLSYWTDKRNSSITIEWKNVVVKDLPSRVPFTFRAKIWSSGLIEFTYDYLGIDLTHLLPFDKDFKIGIGDSVTSLGFVYNYHSVDIPRDVIKDKTKVSLRPLPTCSTRNSCDECVEANLNFHCFWCPNIKKCISGMDFHRPEYSNKYCEKADSKSTCKIKPPFHPSEPINFTPRNTPLKTFTKISNTTSMPKVEPINPKLSTESSNNLPSTRESSSISTLSTKETDKPSELHFLYYNISLVLDVKESKNLWVNMTDTTMGKVKSRTASVSKMQAHQVKLPFPFPFFGNMKNQLSFTGDGFISTMSSWMIHDKTHFIAPLKGLFVHQFAAMTSSVNYKVTSRSVTVQWDTRRYDSLSSYAPFVFQATLHSHGDIDFVYKNLGKMGNSVKEFIGLSEGYSEEMKLGFLLLPKSNPIKYLEHHNVNLTEMKANLSNWTAIKIKALPTCSSQKNCGDCLSMPDISGFKCGWCSTARLCRGSNEAPGEDWIVRNCYSNMLHQEDSCPKDPIDQISYKDFEDLKPDDHKYYKTTFFNKSWGKYFVDFSKKNSTLIKELWKTSNNFLTADSYTLSFMFPFYGHPIQDIMILSGGFISLASSFSKRNLLEHEYIAPLMADLDASYSKEAKIQIYEKDNAITIAWSKMRLVSRPEIDSLSFQLTLMSNGTIIFCYQDIPNGNIPKIISSDLNIVHPVRIGLSDSFVYDAKQAFTNKTTTKMYKYHELDMKSYAEKIQSMTGILFEPLPTCNSLSSCSSCLRADTELNCVWCPGLQFCSDGMDRKRQEWDATRCFLRNVGLRNVTQCPLEMKIIDTQFYNQIIYHQFKPLWAESSSKSLKLHPLQDPSFFHVNLIEPFRFSYFEEEVTSFIISSHGVLGVSNKENKNEPIMYKYIAPFKGNLKFGKNGTIEHAQVVINGVQCYGIEWRNAQYSQAGLTTFQCGLCKDGTIYFHYIDVGNDDVEELNILGINIGLWHGVTHEEFVEMAFDKVDTNANLALSGLVIKFSPITSCSLSSSCLTSPDCPQYSSNNNCSRLTCQDPSDPPGFCPSHKQLAAQSKEQKSEGEGIAVLGVVGGVLLIVFLLGVLVYGIKKLDGRPGRWQTIHSIFQPGYNIFRSGADIGSREFLQEEDRRGTEEINL